MKWLLVEDASTTAIGILLRIREKSSIISFICYTKDSLSNILKGSFRFLSSRHLSFLPPWGVSWASESGCPQEKLARDPNIYTLTSLGTCSEK
jgi:hypothetical protein